MKVQYDILYYVSSVYSFDDFVMELLLMLMLCLTSKSIKISLHMSYSTPNPIIIFYIKILANKMSLKDFAIINKLGLFCLI